MSSLLDNAGGGVVVGSVMGVIALGQFLVRKEFFRPVTAKLDQFPIILKPYRWMVIFSYIIVISSLILGFVIVFFPRPADKVLGGVVIVLSFVLWLTVFTGARKYVRIEPHGIYYIKSPTRFVEIKAQDVTGFFAPPIGGDLVVQVKYQARRIVIPMMFQNSNVLEHFLTKWRLENFRK